MGRKEIKITRRFLSDTSQLIKVFGAIRYDSFLLYLCLYFGICKETAEDLTEKFLQARIITKAKYADTHILKADKKERASSDKLDAFDVYLAVMKEENKTAAEEDKSILEKFEKKRKKGEITLFVYPSRIPSEELRGKKPVLFGSHRLGIVRKSPETGIATCILTDTEGKNDRQR